MSPKEDEKKDQVLEILGDFGRAQMATVIVALLVGIPIAWNIIAVGFFTPLIDHICKPIYANETNGTSMTYEEWQTISKEVLLSNQSLSKCYEMIYTPNESFVNTKTKCSEWVYDLSSYKNSMTSEFDLVCEDDKYITISQVIFLVGVLFGALIGGYTADIFGRIPVVLIFFVLLIVFGTGSAFSQNFITFSCLRVIVGIACMGIYTVGYIYCIEIIGGKWLEIIGIGVQFSFSIGYFTVPLITNALQDWSYLQLVICLPMAPLLLVIPFVPESARWLLSKGRVEKAEDALKFYFRFNGKEWDENTVLEPVTKNEKDSEGRVIDLFITPNIRKNTLIQYFLWFTVGMIYYAMTYNSESFIPGGDVFINALIGGLVEMCAYICTIPIILYLGRRLPTCLNFAFGGVALLMVIVVPEGTPALIMASFGRFFVASCFAILYLFTSELFPTVIRSTGFGSASVSSRIGSIIAPIISRELSKINDNIPLIIFFVFSICAAVLTLFLPETKGKVLPDTVEEGEAFLGNGLIKPSSLNPCKKKKREKYLDFDNETSSIKSRTDSLKY